MLNYRFNITYICMIANNINPIGDDHTLSLRYTGFYQKSKIHPEVFKGNGLPNISPKTDNSSTAINLVEIVLFSTDSSLFIRELTLR